MPGEKSARALAVVALLCATLGAGCEARRYRQAQERGTIAAYLRYLARYPRGQRAASARVEVDRLRFRAVRQADSAFGYRRYLELHPRGRFAGAARRRLAAIALSRARGVADLERLIERFPRSAAAAKARRKLTATLARQAQASDDPRVAARFLALHGDSPAAPAVRERLAGLVFAKIAGQAALERFIQRFAGTRWAREAQKRLRKLLISEIEVSGARSLLELFALRFPNDPELPRLRAAIAARERRRALLRLDLARLAALAPADREVRAVVAWCRKRAQRCARLRQLARAARRWRPRRDVAALSRAAAGADLQACWRAIAELGWIPTAAAADVLWRLSGSARLATVWSASGALRAWYRRCPPAVRQRWSQRLRKRRWRRSNRDELQRRAVLTLLVRPRAKEGGEALAKLLRDKRRSLAAAYLLLAFRPAASGSAPRAMLRAARRRLHRLREGFPAQLDADALPTAILAERELFALLTAWQQVVGATGATQQRQRRVLAEGRALLRGWRLQIARLDKRFAAAHAPRLEPVARRHARGREAALGRLLRARGPAARAVAGAVCQLLRRRTASGGQQPLAGRLARRCAAAKTRGGR